MTTERQLTPEEAGQMIEAAGAADDNPIRQLARELLASGQVNDQTSLADVKNILDQHYAVRK